MAMPIWRRLLRQAMRLALDFARERAGRSMPARIAMMAMTTRRSMSVKPRWEGRDFMSMRGYRLRDSTLTPRSARGSTSLVPPLLLLRSLGDHAVEHLRRRGVEGCLEGNDEAGLVDLGGGGRAPRA